MGTAGAAKIKLSRKRIRLLFGNIWRRKNTTRLQDLEKKKEYFYTKISCLQIRPRRLSLRRWQGLRKKIILRQVISLQNVSFFTCFDEGCDQGRGEDQGKGEVPVVFPIITKIKSVF